MTHDPTSWPLGHIWKTKTDLARDLGESVTTVTSWFAPGRRLPPARFAQVIAAAAARGHALTWEALLQLDNGTSPAPDAESAA